jgi:hypothetical protein
LGCKPCFGGGFGLKHLSNLKNWQNKTKTCGLCNQKINIEKYFVLPQKFLCFSLEVRKVISKYIKVQHQDGTIIKLPLRGIIYSGGHHFTSRFIIDDEIWYHDGIATGARCIREGLLKDFEASALSQSSKREAVAVIYAQ